MTKQDVLCRLAILVVICAMVLFVALPAPVLADGSPSLYTFRQRFGVNVAKSFGQLSDFPSSLSDFEDVLSLGFGWYSDWTFSVHPERPGDIEYAQLLPTKRWPPPWNRVERAARANPGSLWIIGNEPETRGQGGHTPEEYAAIYQQAYYAIKAADPSARVAIGGIVMPSPLRLKWLERSLNHYQATFGEPMPVDVWNIHVQILQEKRGDWGCGIPQGLLENAGRLYEVQDNASVPIFEQLIYDFRRWMYERGEGHKELIISEYGVLMPSSYLRRGDDDVLAFMAGTFDFLVSARDPVLGCPADGGRLVQRWMWYSLNFPFYDETPGGFNGALYHWQRPQEPTIFGAFYRDYVTTLAEGEVTLSAMADTTVDAQQPSRRLGQRGRLKVRGGSQPASALVRFDLSVLPPGALIARAELRLETVASTNPSPLAVAVRPAPQDWDERSSSSELWPNGELPASLGEALLEPGIVLTCDLLRLVRRWCAGEEPNRGLLIGAEGLGPSGNGTYSLASREWAEGPQRGPELWVEYVYHRPAP